MAQTLTLAHRRRSVRSLFSLIHELSLGVFEHRQLREMWDATLWSFVEDLRSRGWTAKSIAQVQGMSRDSLYRTRDARPPNKIDLNVMSVVMNDLKEAGEAGRSLEELDGLLREHSRRHRQNGSTDRLMKVLEVLQSNDCIDMRRGRFYAREGTVFLKNLTPEDVVDNYVDIAINAVRDKRAGRPHMMAFYAIMAPADETRRREFFARIDEEIEAVLLKLEQEAINQGKTSPARIAIGSSQVQDEGA